jgi:hypothetical protein
MGCEVDMETQGLQAAGAGGLSGVLNNCARNAMDLALEVNR